MAYVDRLFLHSADKETGQMTVYVKLQPAGEVSLKVSIPKDFHDCLLKMAQAAADKHEQEMRAQILAEKGQPNDESKNA
jgi:hypothetical protein